MHPKDVTPQHVLRLALSLYNNAVLSHTNIPIALTEDRTVIAKGPSNILDKDTLIDYLVNGFPVGALSLHNRRTIRGTSEDECKYEGEFRPTKAFYRAVDEAITPVPQIFGSSSEDRHSPYQASPPDRFNLTPEEEDQLSRELAITHRVSR